MADIIWKPVPIQRGGAVDYEVPVPCTCTGLRDAPIHILKALTSAPSKVFSPALLPLQCVCLDCLRRFPHPIPVVIGPERNDSSVPLQCCTQVPGKARTHRCPARFPLLARAPRCRARHWQELPSQAPVIQAPLSKPLPADWVRWASHGQLWGPRP